MSLTRPKKDIVEIDKPVLTKPQSRVRSWLLTWEIYPILLVTGFLCLYRIDTTEFNTDQALIFSMARDAIRYGLLPMTSNASSISVSHPPATIYFYMIPAALSANPMGGAVMVGIFTVAAALLTYLFTRRYYGRLAGMVAGLLYASAASTFYYGRLIWQPTLLPLFVTLFMFALFWGVVERRKGWLAPSVMLLGLLYQMHESSALLVVPLLIAVVLAAKTIRWRDVALSALFLFIIYAPYLFWEIQTSFADVHALLSPAQVHLSNNHAIFSSQAISFYRLFLSPYGQQPALPSSVINKVIPWISRLRSIMLLLVLCGAATALLLLLQPQAHSGIRSVEDEQPSRRGAIRTWWADFRTTPAAGGLLLLLIWQIVPLIVLSRPSIILQAHYLIFLMPGPYILVGLFIAKVVTLLRQYRPQWSLLRYGVYAFVVLVILGQLAGSIASVIDITSGNFDDRTFYTHYRNDLGSLQRALSEADSLAQQRHLNRIYITTDASTALALRYLSEQMHTPTMLFDATNCLVLPNPGDRPAVLLVGPYDTLTNALLSQFATATLVDQPVRPGGAPFRLYIVAPTSVQSSSTTGTFGNDLQLLHAQSWVLSSDNSSWLVTRWNLLRSAQPSMRTVYNYTVTAQLRGTGATGQPALCSFTSMHGGDQLLVAFSLPKGRPLPASVTVGVQSFTTTPYNPTYGPLHFETYIDNNTPSITLHTPEGGDAVTVPTL
ncbi:MAG: ArnT family glycosyltransferase [Ktedonobacteraceae bacterium]